MLSTTNRQQTVSTGSRRRRLILKVDPLPKRKLLFTCRRPSNCKKKKKKAASYS